MANEGAGAAIGLGILGFLGFLGLLAAASSSASKDEKKQALLKRIDKDVQEAKDYLKGKE